MESDYIKFLEVIKTSLDMMGVKWKQLVM
jgi:hypothetical protein